MSLILLDLDGNEIATLPYPERAEEVIYGETVFEYEDGDGDDYIYREVAT